MVIIPDAMTLTSGNTIGTGKDDSVKGAKVLLSTKSASRIISDVYAVRKDYFDKNKESVFKFVHALLKSTEDLKTIDKTKMGEYQKIISASADILLDSPQATKDAESLLLDCTFVGWKGNVQFFTDTNYPRSIGNLNSEIERSFIALGLRSKTIVLEKAKFDYNLFREGLKDTSGIEAPHFSKEVIKVIAQKSSQDGKLFEFSIQFKPNQDSFLTSVYEEEFKKVVEFSTTYAGAVINIEGHSDPRGFLKAQERNDPEVILKRIKQSSKNLSLSRANAVRDSIISYSKNKGITLDESQFTTSGLGISNPLYDNPKTESEWLSNMRVQFQMFQVEAEESVFNPQ
jgi:outer membrane protein OmpA-like peptidoglycan-associated protein